MEGGVIDRVLRTNQVTRKYFLGTYPADRIPRIFTYPASLVVNMDNSSKPGSHWVGIFVRSPSEVVYYDSFGIEPYNKNIKNFLQTFEKVERNPITFQSIDSDICGLFVIYFLYFCSLGYSNKKILRSLRTYDNPNVHVYRFTTQNIMAGEGFR